VPGPISTDPGLFFVFESKDSNLIAIFTSFNPASSGFIPSAGRKYFCEVRDEILEQRPYKGYGREREVIGTLFGLRRPRRGESVLMMRTQEIGTLALELAMGADRTSEFESVALPHAASLLRYAMHLDDRGKAEAEDLVQETLLAAWHNFSQFESGTNCKAWLFRILINLRYKRLRRTGRREVPLEAEESHLSRPENISRNAEMRAAFARLSPEHQEVMQLAVVEGFEIREIGEMLRIPTGTVMSRLSRARAQLRAVLEAAPPSHKEKQ